jgi:hypothetical protein
MEHRLMPKSFAKYLLTLLISVIGCLYAPTVKAQPTDQVLEVIPPGPGALRLRIEPNGETQIERNFGGNYSVITQQFSTFFYKGSFIYTNFGKCGLGGFFPAGSGQTNISNTLDAGALTVTTVVDCTDAGVRFTQVARLRSIALAPFVEYTWTLENIRGVTISDVRFFHAHDPEFAVDFPDPEIAQGYISQDKSVVGGSQVVLDPFSMTFVETISMSSEPAMLRAHAGSSTTITVLPSSPDPQLSGTASSGDITLAGEWRTTNLAANQTFTIVARERYFATPAPGSEILVRGPVRAPHTGGSTTNHTFEITNLSGSPAQVVGLLPSVLSRAPGWNTTIVSPPAPSPGSPLTIAPGNSAVVVVSLQSPLGTLVGDQEVLELTATTTDLTQYLGEILIDVDTALPTPTPTPTSTSTSTPTPTATVTPTATSTPIFTSTPNVPTPTATPLPNAFNISLTAPLRSANTSTPLITGRAFPGSSVTVRIGGEVINSVTSPSGIWTAQTLIPLGFGPHTVSADALDPFGRFSSTQSAQPFVITTGAPLDFDGDGLTDITRFSTTGSSVIFRIQRSSNDTAATISLPGSVPAAGDYFGTGTWEVGTIAKNNQTFTWRVRSSQSGSIVSEDFGEVGDQMLTGCKLVTPKRASMARLIGGKSVIAKDIGGESREFSNVTTGTIIGCTDENGDGLDEFVVREPKGDNEVTLRIVARDGNSVVQGDFRRFDRAFPLALLENPTPAQNAFPDYGFGLVRLASSGARVAELITKKGPPATPPAAYPTLRLPRKVIMSTGLFLAPGPSVVPLIIFQDLRRASLNVATNDGVAIEANLGRVPARTSLLIPQYIHRTR